MVRHILLIRLKDGCKDRAEELSALFLSMRGRVPQVIDVESGVDFLHSERSYDVCLCVTLADRAALDEYQKDPYHCGVVKPFVASIRETAAAVDFETDGAKSGDAE